MTTSAQSDECRFTHTDENAMIGEAITLGNKGQPLASDMVVRCCLATIGLSPADCRGSEIVWVNTHAYSYYVDALGTTVEA